jgi:DNA gyrase subunit B
MAKKQVEQNDYDALDSISAVRINTGMFIGDTETPNHLATEVVDNMLDEIANGFATHGDIYIDDEDKSFWVSDNGRGLKVGVSKDPDTGEMKDSIELLCTKLFSGSKFRLNEKVDYAVQIGMHGVGLVVVNALSDWLVIRIRKNQEIHEYIFLNSKLDSSTKRPKTEEETYSTQVGFKPSEKYFENLNFDVKMFVSRLLLTQSVYDNANFTINGTSIPKITLYDYAKNTLGINKDSKLYQVSKSFGKNEKIRIFLDYIDSKDSLVVGDVNLRTCDGTYIANIQTMVKDIISNNIDRKFRSLDDKEFLTGLRLYCSLTLEKPKFDAQIKSRMKTNIKKYLLEIEKDLTKILTRDDIMKTLTSLLEQKVTKKLVSNANGSKRISNTNKLRDCIRSPGDVLYIVEGDSADGTLKQFRNKETEGCFPLKGKILNVEKGNVVRIEKNKEVQDLIEALGPEGRRRYKRIKLLSDADADGLEGLAPDL